MSILDGVGIEFKESMSGHLGVGATDPGDGLEQGMRDGTECRFSVSIRIDDLATFTSVSDHVARLTGLTSLCEPFFLAPACLSSLVWLPMISRSLVVQTHKKTGWKPFLKCS